MAGICKYCGFSGTHEMLADHAGHCPPEQSPPDDVVEKIHINQQLKDGICPKCYGHKSEFVIDGAPFNVCSVCKGTGKRPSV